MNVTVKPISETAETVVLNKADYEALLQSLEDAEARAAYRQSRSEETFPAEVADRMMAGSHPLRVFRQYRGLTLTALAQMAGVSVSYLSEIESGRKPGSARTLNAVAKVLDLEVEDLI